MAEDSPDGGRDRWGVKISIGGRLQVRAYWSIVNWKLSNVLRRCSPRAISPETYRPRRPRRNDRSPSILYPRLNHAYAAIENRENLPNPCPTTTPSRTRNDTAFLLGPLDTGRVVARTPRLVRMVGSRRLLIQYILKDALDNVSTPVLTDILFAYPQCSVKRTSSPDAERPQSPHWVCQSW